MPLSYLKLTIYILAFLSATLLVLLAQIKLVNTSTSVFLPDNNFNGNLRQYSTTHLLSPTLLNTNLKATQLLKQQNNWSLQRLQNKTLITITKESSKESNISNVVNVTQQIRQTNLRKIRLGKHNRSDNQSHNPKNIDNSINKTLIITSSNQTVKNLTTENPGDDVFSPHRIDPSQPMGLTVKEDVNLYTGGLYINYPLKSLPNRNGLDISLNLKYSTHSRNNCHKIDPITGDLIQYPYYGCQNDINPLGDGWSYYYGFIYRDSKDTPLTDDDEYYVVMPSGERQKLVKTSEHQDYDEYDTRITHFWKIKAWKSNDEANMVGYTSWTLTDSSGNNYYFNHPRLMIYQDLYDADNYGKRLAYQWDLTRIQDLFNNYVNISYEDLTYPLDSGIAKRYELYGNVAGGNWPYFGDNNAYQYGQTGTYYTLWSNIKQVFNGIGHYYKFHYNSLSASDHFLPSLNYVYITSNNDYDGNNIACPGGFSSQPAGSNGEMNGYSFFQNICNNLSLYDGSWVIDGVWGGSWMGLRLSGSHFEWPVGTSLSEPLTTTLRTFFSPNELENGYYAITLDYSLQHVQENCMPRISIMTQKNHFSLGYPYIFDDYTHIASIIHNYQNYNNVDELALTFYYDKRDYPNGLWLTILTDTISVTGDYPCLQDNQPGNQLTFKINSINMHKLTPRQLDYIVLDTNNLQTITSENNLVYKFNYDKMQVPIDYNGNTKNMSVLKSITPLKAPKYLISLNNPIAELPSTKFEYYTQTDGDEKAGLLKKVTYPTRGYTIYDYNTNFNNDFIVVTSKDVYGKYLTNDYSLDSQVFYSYQNPMNDNEQSTNDPIITFGNSTVTIQSDTPNYVEYSFLQPDHVLKGTMISSEKGMTSNSYIKNDYTYQAVDKYNNRVFCKELTISQTQKHENGNSITYKTTYSDFNDYCEPEKILYFGNTNTDGDEKRLELEYWYNTQYNVLNLVKTKRLYDSISGGNLISDTTYDYYNDEPFVGKLWKINNYKLENGEIFTTTNEYWDNGNLKKVTYPKGNWVQYVYDNDYNLFVDHKINSEYGTEWWKEYQPFGQVKKVIDGNNAFIEYTYDPFDRLQTIRWNDQNENEFYYIVNYNDFDIPRSLEIIQPDEQAIRRAKYFYDGLGRLIETRNRYIDIHKPQNNIMDEPPGGDDCSGFGGVFLYFNSSDCEGACTGSGCVCNSFPDPDHLGDHDISICADEGVVVGKFANYNELYPEDYEYYDYAPKNPQNNLYYVCPIVDNFYHPLHTTYHAMVGAVHEYNIKTTLPSTPEWVGSDLCEWDGYSTPAWFSFVMTTPEKQNNCYVTQRDWDSNSFIHLVDCCEQGEVFNYDTGECEEQEGGGDIDFNVGLQAQPSQGQAPLTNVDLTATVSTDYILNWDDEVIYKFDCEDDGFYDLVDTVLVGESNQGLTYHAQDLCNYTSVGTYTARVRTIIRGVVRQATTIINVNEDNGQPFCENECNFYEYPKCDDNDLKLCINTDNDTCFEIYTLEGACSASASIINHISYNEFGLKDKISKPDSSAGYGSYIEPSWDDLNKIEYSYDGIKRLTQLKNYDGTTINYEYGITNNENEWKKIVDENGHTTTYYYDAYGQLVKVGDALDQETTYDYDTMGDLVQINLPNSKLIKKDYNSLGQLVKEENPDTGITRFGYDENGNIKYNLDANGNVKTFDYDSIDRIKEIHYANKPNTKYYYDSCQNGTGRLCKIEDASGVKQFNYDNRGRLVSETKTIDDDSYTFNYDYTDGDYLKTVTDAFSRQFTYNYNALGYTHTVDYEGNNLLSFDYMPTSKVDHIGYGGGVITSFDYDVRDRLKTIDSTIDEVDESYVYDNVNNILAVCSGLSCGTNPKITLLYDDLNRLTTVFDHDYLGYGNDIQEQYYYDELGNRKRIKPFSFGQTEDYLYYNDGRMLLKPAEEASTNRLGYDPVKETQYWYDANGNIIQKSVGYIVIDDDSEEISKNLAPNPGFEYVHIGGVLPEEFWEDEYCQYSIQDNVIDADCGDGRLNYTIGPIDTSKYKFLEIVYNVSGSNNDNLYMQLVRDDGTTKKQKMPSTNGRHVYLANLDLIKGSEDCMQGSCNSNVLNKLIFSTQGIMGITIYSISIDREGAPNGWVEYEWQNGENHNADSSVLMYELTTDAHSNNYALKMHVDNSDQVFNKELATMPIKLLSGQYILSAFLKGNLQNGQAYMKVKCYDNDDNIHEIASLTIDQLHSQWERKMLDFTVPYDKTQCRVVFSLPDSTYGDIIIDDVQIQVGNQVTDYEDPIIYHYDEDDNLIKIEMPNKQISYVYDSNGNRIKKDVLKLTSSETSVYIYGKSISNELEIKTSSQEQHSRRRISQTPLTLGYHGPPITFSKTQINSSYVNVNNQLLAKIVKQNDNNEERFYYHNNWQGSPRAVTNEDGQVVWQTRYEPFGKPVQEATLQGLNNNAINKYKFNAKELDMETGLYYYGARYYDKHMGRFIIADALGGDTTNPQSFNLYAYTLNNPLRFVDPDGNRVIDDDVYFSAGVDVTPLGNDVMSFASISMEASPRAGLILSGNDIQSLNLKPSDTLRLATITTEIGKIRKGLVDELLNDIGVSSKLPGASGLLSKIKEGAKTEISLASVKAVYGVTSNGVENKQVVYFKQGFGDTKPSFKGFSIHVAVRDSFVGDLYKGTMLTVKNPKIKKTVFKTLIPGTPLVANVNAGIQVNNVFLNIFFPYNPNPGYHPVIQESMYKDTHLIP